MSHHAGFAAALSISRSAIQEFLHAAYINDLIRTNYRGMTNTKNLKAVPPFTYALRFDLFMAEPQAVVAPNDQNHVAVKLEFLGNLIFEATGQPTLTCDVQLQTTVGMPVRMARDDQKKTLQFGMDPKRVAISSFRARRTGGDDPSPIYGIDLNEELRLAIFVALFASDARQFLITPPLLDEFVRLGYILLEPEVRITEDCLNVGMNVEGLTLGTTGALVDLNTLSTSKGWKKTFTDHLKIGSDEFGRPLYDIGWTGATQRNAGPHNSQIAVSLHSVVLNDIFDKIGRYEVFRRFEEEKYKSVLKSLGALKGKARSYSAPDNVRIVLNELYVSLEDNLIKVRGKATFYTDIEVKITFSLKLRLTRTYVEGTYSFMSKHQQRQGFTAEVVDVAVDKPELIEAIQALGVIAGVALAPFTAGISLVVMLFFEIVVESTVSAVLGNAERKAASSISNGISSNQAQLPFTLPGTKGPELVLQVDDVVVQDAGITGWSNLYTRVASAHIVLEGYPGTTWEVTNRQPIGVLFDDRGQLYNPHDPKVRIRWEVYGDSTSTLVSEVDVPINAVGVGNPKRIAIDHASDALDRYDAFLVKCRVYRPWGDWTQEIFQGQLKIAIVDRLSRKHPYVRWEHEAFYVGYSAKLLDAGRHATGWVRADRHSKIHYTDPDKRCRFADRYSPDLQKEQLEYFDVLPFDLTQIAIHRRLVCPYCFFGGPDKTVLKS